MRERSCGNYRCRISRGAASINIRNQVGTCNWMIFIWVAVEPRGTHSRWKTTSPIILWGGNSTSVASASVSHEGFVFTTSTCSCWRRFLIFETSAPGYYLDIWMSDWLEMIFKKNIYKSLHIITNPYSRSLLYSNMAMENPRFLDDVHMKTFMIAPFRPPFVGVCPICSHDFPVCSYDFPMNSMQNFPQRSRRKSSSPSCSRWRLAVFNICKCCPQKRQGSRTRLKNSSLKQEYLWKSPCYNFRMIES